MTKYYIRADITTAPMAPKINYPGDWYENVKKIFVRAYDDVNRKCLAWLTDEELFNSLMATGRVEELSEEEFEAEVLRLRPPAADVQIRLSKKAVDSDPGLQTALENLAIGRGHSVKVEKR